MATPLLTQPAQTLSTGADGHERIEPLSDSQAENAGSIPVARSKAKGLVNDNYAVTSLLRVSGSSAIHPASASSFRRVVAGCHGLPQLVVDALRHRAIGLRCPVEVAQRGLRR